MSAAPGYLFPGMGAVPQARRTDPPTSKAAAVAAYASAEGQCARILAYLRTHGRATGDAIACELGLTMEAVCRRLANLEDDGEAQPVRRLEAGQIVDVTATTRRGRQARVWEARP